MREHPRNWLCQAAGGAPWRGLAKRNEVREDWGCFTLRCQALAYPGAAFDAVAQPVVQPALAALPELPAVGHQAEAAPVRRARRVEQELRAVLRGVAHQHRAALD